MFMLNCFLCCYTCIPFIYVDVHLKTIFAVTLALVSEDASLLQGCLPVQFEVHETFMRKDMKHSNFSNYFIICLPSFFSPIIEVIIELLVV